mmetsp:Transcript_85492/g.207212  ORF Transcript_85492/g.207212 Transcript_85492/m.207212 type:complete len:259 (-) Transcript_85492:17-793(-)
MPRQCPCSRPAQCPVTHPLLTHNRNQATRNRATLNRATRNPATHSRSSSSQAGRSPPTDSPPTGSLPIPSRASLSPATSSPTTRSSPATAAAWARSWAWAWRRELRDWSEACFWRAPLRATAGTSRTRCSGMAAFLPSLAGLVFLVDQGSSAPRRSGPRSSTGTCLEESRTFARPLSTATPSGTSPVKRSLWTMAGEPASARAKAFGQVRRAQVGEPVNASARACLGGVGAKVRPFALLLAPQCVLPFFNAAPSSNCF